MNPPDLKSPLLGTSPVGEIYLASDHAGLELKSTLVAHLQGLGFFVHDLGPSSAEKPVDYPDFANQVCLSLLGWSPIVSASSLPQTSSPPTSQLMGILICGSGQGMCMRANKYSHIRAALCWNPLVAQVARQHNDANVLCLGARFTPKEEALKILEVFLSTPFEGGRHQARVCKIEQPT